MVGERGLGGYGGGFVVGMVGERLWMVGLAWWSEDGLWLWWG